MMVDQHRFTIYFDIITRHFPGVTAGAIHYFPGGYDHDVFVVGDEIIGEFAEKYTFRFPKERQRIDPKRARFLTRSAHQSPVAFPQITIHQDPLTGIEYELNPFLPGVALDGALAATFAKAELLRIAQHLGGFLSALHNFPLDEARSLDVDEMDPTLFWEYMAHHPHAYPHYRQAVFPYLTVQEQLWVQRLFDDYIDLIRATPFAVRVTHNDLWTHHIIVDPVQRVLSGVIDFGLRIADPAADFKAVEHYGRDFVDELYRHYHAPVDEHFEQRRLFYTGHDLVFDLDRALEDGDAEAIATKKQALSAYIRAHSG